MANLTQFHLDCHKLFDGVKLFPIEMDLAKSAFQNPHGLTEPEYHDNLSEGEEVEETPLLLDPLEYSGVEEHQKSHRKDAGEDEPAPVLVISTTNLAQHY